MKVLHWREDRLNVVIHTSPVYYIITVLRRRKWESPCFKPSCQQWVSDVKVEPTNLARYPQVPDIKETSRMSDDNESTKPTSSRATTVGYARSVAKLKQEQIKAELLVKATTLKQRRTEQAKD